MTVLPELGKLTGARKATGASDAGRGYRRARLNFHFFPDGTSIYALPHFARKQKKVGKYDTTC